ncbi:MAG: hypothetical protein FJY88_11355 [Candidatus Eisenbacteria bacterium]|nr:hypothetical protein [Candidatus Eisenbacteria bacterium]
MKENDTTARGPVKTTSPLARSLICLLLLSVLLSISASPECAWAGGADSKMKAITKTTLYGALLGGLLGLASALVVRDGYEDDAVRWGIVSGTFAGFIYGILSDEESDEFSILRDTDVRASRSSLDLWGDGPSPHWRLAPLKQARFTAGLVPASPEVSHDAIPKEGEERREGLRRAVRQEGVDQADAR